MENIFANIGANVSESEKFCRVYGSSILTVKQSKKGWYWISFLYSLLARVQDTHTCTNTYDKSLMSDESV